jgi:hypothetical protein
MPDLDLVNNKVIKKITKDKFPTIKFIDFVFEFKILYKEKGKSMQR